MAIDPSILLSTTPIKYPDLVEQRAKALQLQSLQQNNQLGQQQLQQGALQNQQLQQSISDDQKLRQMYATGEPVTPEKMIQTVGAKTAAPLIKAHLENEETKTKLQKAADEHAAALADIRGNIAQGVKASNYSPASLQYAMGELSLRDPQGLQLFQQASKDPAALSQLVDMAIQQSPKQRELADKDKAAKLAQDEFEAKKPGIQAENDAKEITNARSALANAATPQEYADIYGGLKARVAASLPRPGSNPDFNALKQQAGLTPDQEATTTQTAAQRVEQMRHNKVEESQGSARLANEGARLKVEQFNAGVGADGKPLQDSDKALLAPVVQRTTDGRTFLDEGTAFKNLPRGQQMQLRQAAVNAGVPMLSSQDATSVQKLDSVRQNLDGVFDIYAKNAASSPATRMGSYLENKFGTVLQTNPELKGAEGNKLGLFETLRGALGRVNQTEIKKAEGMLPELGDTKAVIENKRQQFTQFLDQHLNGLTHANQGKPLPANPADLKQVSTEDLLKRLSQ